MEDNKKPLPLIERLKQQAAGQQREQVTIADAQTQVTTCTNCGAGRAKQDGLTHCAYCGYAFTAHRMSEGIHINQRDNSQ